MNDRGFRGSSLSGSSRLGRVGWFATWLLPAPWLVRRAVAVGTDAASFRAGAEVLTDHRYENHRGQGDLRVRSPAECKSQHAMERRLWPLLVGLGYIALIYFLGGLRPDHVEIGLLSLLYYYNQKTRLFLRYFLPFILTGAVYDFMRYFYWQGITGHIYVKEPYQRELSWFGIPVNGNTTAGIGPGYGLMPNGGSLQIAGATGVSSGAVRYLTPNEFFLIHQSKILDLICGFAYIIFVGESLCLAAYFFLAEKFRLLTAFAWSFFIVNVMGYMTYYIYPAAPPWYVSEYGLGPARLDAHPESGAAVRFDEILGTHFFKGMYGRGVDVYGAYPSLHVAYPLIVVWFTFQVRELKGVRLPAILFYFLMCFSAVYLQHHFVVDIILGSLYATAVIFGARGFLRKAVP